jgi:hypothetical protein
MRVFGADFSGARDPSGRIYIAAGWWNEDRLHIESVVPCDDRLDLFAHILKSGGVWGLDFPFAFPFASYELLGLIDWGALLEWVSGSSREQYLERLTAYHALVTERPCLQAGLCCRATDAAVQAQSVFKQVNPSMRVMTYSGLKLLHYLCGQGVAVYPFDNVSAKENWVAEVYPSHTWQALGYRQRTMDLRELPDRLHHYTGYALTVNASVAIPKQDAADAMLACVTMALAIRAQEFATGQLPANWTEAERSVYQWEGGIVRITERATV